MSEQKHDVSAALRASLDGYCPAQRISDRNSARVDGIGNPSSVRQTGWAVCARCGRTVRVTRRWDDGRWGWSVWRYDLHRLTVPTNGGE